MPSPKDPPKQAGRVHVQEFPPLLVGESKTLNHSFLVENDTGRSVKIEQITHSCSCTTAKPDTTDLGAGEKTRLNLEADLVGRKGMQLFSCNLYLSGDPIPRQYILQTTLYPRLGCEPASVDFGLVDSQAVQEREVAILTHAPLGQPPAEVTEARGATTHLAVALEQPGTEVLPDGLTRRKTKIKIRLGPVAAAGRGTDQIVIKAAGRNETIHELLPVSWEIRSPYQVSPARVFFGDVSAVEEPVERTVTIRRADGRVIAVQEIEPCNPALSCTFLAAPDGAPETALLLRLDPARLAGTISEQLTVRVNDRTCPVIRIPVTAIQRRVRHENSD